MAIDLAHYYDRFDSDDNFDRHLFRAGYPLQSAELNELQSSSQDRLKRIADILFDEGSVLSGADCFVDIDTGLCRCSGGAIYVRGAARGVEPREFTIPLVGLVSVGVYLSEQVVTESADARLRDPAVSSRNYQEPGAGRLRVALTWGLSTEGLPGDYYEIHRIEDGLLLSNVPPPQIDAVSLAIARYDRQSAGGYYVSSGMMLTRLEDSGGSQVFSMASGTARIGGNEILRVHARRFEHAAVADTRSVSLEPHMASGGVERVNVNSTPIASVSMIALTREKTLTVTHGAFSGAQDLLPNRPVVQILSVTQGETTYADPADYTLTADKVDWSSAGAEPAPGSNYSVTYRYVATVAPEALDGTGFSVSDAVPGTLIQVSYSWSLPRIDVICLSRDGDPVVVKGLSAVTSPRIPGVPDGMLGIGRIEQYWDARTRLYNDAVRMVSMSDLNDVNTRIDSLFALVAEERLAHNLTTKDPTTKRGVFVDPFYDDDMRDQGIEQTAAIFGEVMTLGLMASAFTQTLDAVQTLDARVLVELDVVVGPDEVVLEQMLATGCMQINPYFSFGVMPGIATLYPSVDFWTETKTVWLSPETRIFEIEVVARILERPGARSRIPTLRLQTPQESVRGTEVERVGTAYVDLQYLRQIPVRFKLMGFGPGEELVAVTFDGLPVDFEAVP